MAKWLDGFKVVKRRPRGKWGSCMVSWPLAGVYYIPGQKTRRKSRGDGPLAVFTTLRAAFWWARQYTLTPLEVLPCKYTQSKQRALWVAGSPDSRLREELLPSGTDFANIVIVGDRPIGARMLEARNR